MMCAGSPESIADAAGEFSKDSLVYREKLEKDSQDLKKYIKSRIPEDKFVDLPKARIEAEKEFLREKKKRQKLNITVIVVIVLISVFVLLDSRIISYLAANKEMVAFIAESFMILAFLVFLPLVYLFSKKSNEKKRHALESMDDWQKLKMYARMDVEEEAVGNVLYNLTENGFVNDANESPRYIASVKEIVRQELGEENMKKLPMVKLDAEKEYYTEKKQISKTLTKKIIKLLVIVIPILAAVTLIVLTIVGTSGKELMNSFVVPVLVLTMVVILVSYLAIHPSAKVLH